MLCACLEILADDDVGADVDGLGVGSFAASDGCG